MLASVFQPQSGNGFVLERFFLQGDSLFDLLIGLVVSTLLTLALVQTYRATHRGAVYSASFLQALFILTVCVTLIMVVIGSNVARAFSLVGALSIVRFRTAIKDPRDVGFVFAALGLGMASGTGFYLQAILFTLFLCALLLVLARLNVGHAESNEAIVRVTLTEEPLNGAREAVEAALKSANAQPMLINRVLDGSGAQTFSWRTRTGDSQSQGELQERLRQIEGVTSVGVYVMDDFNVL